MYRVEKESAKTELRDFRKNYKQGKLEESKLPDNPFALFAQWFEEAASQYTSVTEANAMILSTSLQDYVDSRVVLLKDLRDDQFVFYTNYESIKGQHLLANPSCSLVFPWIAMERQVIIRGVASKVSEDESKEYFFSRPTASQIGAWSSSQSTEIGSREELEGQLKQSQERFENEEITMPNYWGGYQVEPIQIEFWQGRENRLHDRILFEKNGKTWSRKRLQP